MFLSTLSINKPYFAFMVNLVIIIFGFMAYQRIPIANNPNVDLPYVWVGLSYPNGSPQTEEDYILKPLEDSIKSISGVKSLHGKAKEGHASVFVEFSLETSSQKAYEDVRNAVSALSFPHGAETPKVIKIQMDDEPIITLVASAPHLSIEDLSTLIKDHFKPRLQQITGVSNVSLYGDRYPEIHINLLQNYLNAYQISPIFVKNEVESRILNRNIGQFKDGQSTYPLSIYNIPNNISSLEKMPLTTAHNNLIHLEDIAQVKHALTEATSYSEYNGVSALSLSVSKEAQGNVVQTAKDIRKVVESLNNEYKDKVHLDVLQDDSKFIERSIKGIQFDIVLGSLFAVLVVLLFLHEWKNTLICMVAIPTSLIGALAIIHAFHFSLNFMTLFALTLCVGIVIDDAIVVVENIHRHRALGKNAFQAAKDGTSEIGFAAIAVTIAIVSVFVPVAFMKGLIGRFFYEFGITVVAAVSISLFVAFTIVPMFSSRLKIDNHQKRVTKLTKFAAKFNVYFQKILDTYVSILTKMLHYKKTVLASAFVIFIISIGLLKLVPVVFNNTTDENSVRVLFNLEQNTSLEMAQTRGQEIGSFIKELPGVKSVLMRVGSDSEGSQNTIKFSVFLVDKNHREFTDKEFLNFVTKELNQFIRNPKESVKLSHRNYPLQFSLLSQSPELLEAYGKELADYMNTLPDVSGATTSVENPVIELRILPNETELSLVHVNPIDLSQTLQLLFGGMDVGKYNDNGKYIDIKMMLPESHKSNISELKSTLIPTKNGYQTLLSSVADISEVDIAPKIEHLDGERVLNVRANYTGKDLAKVTEKVQSHIEKTLPIGIQTKLAGDSSELKELFKIVGSTMILALIFVFIVLIVQFENFLAPSVIILSIPFAFSGAFLALLLTGQSLSITSMIGLFMLMGIVTKNAILLIEFTQKSLETGLEITQSLLEAVKVRFRPIIMTTLTMVAGMLPMALSRAEGSELSTNIAITVIGGLISSTILTLLIIPTVYLFLHSLFSKRFKKGVL